MGLLATWRGWGRWWGLPNPAATTAPGGQGRSSPLQAAVPARVRLVHFEPAWKAWQQAGMSNELKTRQVWPCERFLQTGFSTPESSAEAAGRGVCAAKGCQGHALAATGRHRGWKGPLGRDRVRDESFGCCNLKTKHQKGICTTRMNKEFKISLAKQLLKNLISTT